MTLAFTKIMALWVEWSCIRARSDLRIRRKLASVPMLALTTSPQSLRIYKNRRLDRCPEAIEVLRLAKAEEVPVLALFPGKHAQDLRIAAAALEPRAPRSPAVDSGPWAALGLSRPRYVLVAFDGTWKEAQEMRTAAQPALLEAGAIEVQLPGTGAAADVPPVGPGGLPAADAAEFVPRREPAPGYTSTLSAVAAAVEASLPCASSSALSFDQSILSIQARAAARGARGGAGHPGCHATAASPLHAAASPVGP